MSNSSKPIDLARTPVHIPGTRSDEASFSALDWFQFDGPSFEKYVTDICQTNNPGRLVMIEATPSNWGTWERHTQGDELVIVITGSGVFHQEIDGQIVSTSFGPGDTVLNPAGIWHTADVSEPMRAVYITPCPGTENKPRN